MWGSEHGERAFEDVFEVYRAESQSGTVAGVIVQLGGHLVKKQDRPSPQFSLHHPPGGQHERDGERSEEAERAHGDSFNALVSGRGPRGQFLAGLVLTISSALTQPGEPMAKRVLAREARSRAVF